MAWLLVFGVLFVGVQTGLSPYSWALAYVYVVSLSYPLPVSAWVAFATGLALDALAVGRLGISSLVFLGILGVVQVLISARGKVTRRQFVTYGAFYLPFTLVSGIIAESFARFVGDVVVFVIVYATLQFVANRGDAIMVRRSL